MGFLTQALDFISLRKKVEIKETTIEELQAKLEENDRALRAMILKNYPIGSVVGICSQKEAKRFIIVGHIVEEVTIPLIQIACINPRADNAFSVSNYDYNDVMVHGYWNDIVKES